MVTPEEVYKAEETLTKFLAVFRAAGTMLESIEVIKVAVLGLAAIQKDTAAAQSNLDAVNGALGKARVELAAANAESEKINKASAAVKAELAKLGLR